MSACIELDRLRQIRSFETNSFNSYAKSINIWFWVTTRSGDIGWRGNLENGCISTLLIFVQILCTTSTFIQVQVFLPLSYILFTGDGRPQESPAFGGGKRNVQRVASPCVDLRTISIRPQALSTYLKSEQQLFFSPCPFICILQQGLQLLPDHKHPLHGICSHIWLTKFLTFVGASSALVTSVEMYHK